MSNNERLPEEFWGVRLAKRLLNLSTFFTASFEDSKLVMFREQQTKIKTPTRQHSAEIWPTRVVQSFFASLEAVMPESLGLRASAR